MATGSKEDVEMFIEYNAECDVVGLLEWIVELLPQHSFDNYVAQIRKENE